MRTLESSDYAKGVVTPPPLPTPSHLHTPHAALPVLLCCAGFLQLLAQLTTVGDISQDAFEGE